MMLDLNVNVIYNELPEGSVPDESGTSNSSLLNAEATTSTGDGESCSTRAGEMFAFNFGILKVGGAETSRNINNNDEDRRVVSHSEFVTRQLFPVDNGELNRKQTDRVILPGFGSELPKPQVKKSRRGPRSRSSQYRGVTFYRRTGRWESHIWLVFSAVNFLIRS